MKISQIVEILKENGKNVEIDEIIENRAQRLLNKHRKNITPKQQQS